MWNDKESSGDVIIEEKTENPDEIVVTRMTNNDPKPNSFTDDLATSAKAVAQKTGEVLNKATESISKAIETALSARAATRRLCVSTSPLRSRSIASW